MDRPNLPTVLETRPLPTQSRQKRFHETTKGRITIFALVALFISAAVAININATASGAATCSAFSTGSMPDLSSVNISFSCASTVDTDGRALENATNYTVYFGVCDSGSVANDDLFTLSFNGSVVSSNRFENNRELVTIGTASVGAGGYAAMLNSVSSNASPPATYGYGISTSYGEVVNFLQRYCGSDIINPALSAGSGCVKIIPVRTEGQAPTNGKLLMKAQYGSQNRPEGYTIGYWQIQAGQYLNNAPVYVPAPQHARLWWQPEGSEDWYLLPSQYWHNDGTLGSEYGASCTNEALPSYHTAFNKAIHASQVPLLNR